MYVQLVVSLGRDNNKKKIFDFGYEVIAQDTPEARDATRPVARQVSTKETGVNKQT
jgi:hypothetical protein